MQTDFNAETQRQKKHKIMNGNYREIPEHGNSEKEEREITEREISVPSVCSCSKPGRPME